MNPEFQPKPPYGGPFSPIDIDQILDAPSRGSRHRRAHSDTFFAFSNELLFDASDLEIPYADAPMAVDSCRSDCSNSGINTAGATNRPPPPIGPSRSFSMDADFFEGLSFGAFDGGDSGGNSTPLAVPSPSGENRAGFHRRNKSMDGSSSSFEADSLLDGVKRTMPPEKLAELALIDPKGARRILANRQSAARSKERRVRHAGELEKKFQTLQTEATTLSAQVTILQQDTTGLTSENGELKLRLEALEQQALLKDALNETLREEVQRLWIAGNHFPSNNNGAPTISSNPFSCQQTQQPQFHVPQPSSNPFGSQQTQPPQFHMSQPSSNPFGWQQTQQPQFHVPQSSSNDPNSVQQIQSDFLRFKPRG